jgi:hypothetical protein
MRLEAPPSWMNAIIRMRALQLAERITSNWKQAESLAENAVRVSTDSTISVDDQESRMLGGKARVHSYRCMCRSPPPPGPPPCCAE